MKPFLVRVRFGKTENTWYLCSLNGIQIYMLRKNIFLFYLLLLLPISIFVLAAKYGYIDSILFALMMLIYVFLYHPFICGIRLVKSGKISRQDFWKNFIPFWNDKYWTFLFFNR